MKQLLRRGRHSFHLRLFLAMALVVFLFIPGAGYIAYLQARKAIDDHMAGRPIASDMTKRLAEGQTTTAGAYKKTWR